MSAIAGRRGKGSSSSVIGSKLGSGLSQEESGLASKTIRAKTRRTRGDSLARVIADLNRILRGWFGYFQHAHPRTFIVLDKFIRRRLRALLRKQENGPASDAARPIINAGPTLLRPSRAARVYSAG